MKINQFIKKASMGLMLALLFVVVSSSSANTKVRAMSRVDYCTGASYNVSYDSFVYGALPIWIDRTCDEGPAIVTVRIRIGEASYYENVYLEGTSVQQTFNQYAGPYFVEVDVYQITYL